MKYHLISALLISFVILSLGCQKKEDFTETKKDLALLQKNWAESQVKLRETIDDLKADQQKFSKARDVLTSAKNTAKNNQRKLQLDEFINRSNNQLSVLKVEMDSLNQYMKGWSERSKNLNQLIQGVKDETITVAAATENITQLRAYKALADPKLESIREILKKLKESNQEVDAFMAAAKTTKAKK